MNHQSATRRAQTRASVPQPIRVLGPSLFPGRSVIFSELTRRRNQNRSFLIRTENGHLPAPCPIRSSLRSSFALFASWRESFSYSPQSISGAQVGDGCSEGTAEESRQDAKS